MRWSALIACLLLVSAQVMAAADYENTTISILNFIAGGAEPLAELSVREGEVKYVDLDGRSYTLAEGAGDVLRALSRLEKKFGEAQLVYAVYDEGRKEMEVTFIVNGSVSRAVARTQQQLWYFSALKRVLESLPSGSVLLGCPPNQGHDWTVYLTDDGRVVLLGCPPNQSHSWTVYRSQGNFSFAVLTAREAAVVTESFAALAAKRANQETFSSATALVSAGEVMQGGGELGSAFERAKAAVLKPGRNVLVLPAAADYSNSTIDILNFIAGGAEPLGELSVREGEVKYIDLDGRSFGLSRAEAGSVLEALSELEELAGRAQVVYAEYSGRELRMVLKYADGREVRLTRAAPAALAKIREVLGAREGGVLLGIPPNSGHEWTVYLADDGRVVLFALGNDIVGTGRQGNLYRENGYSVAIYRSQGNFSFAVLTAGGGGVVARGFASLAVRPVNEEVYSTALVSGGGVQEARLSDAFAKAVNSFSARGVPMLTTIVLVLPAQAGEAGVLAQPEVPPQVKELPYEAEFVPFSTEQEFVAAIGERAIDALLGRGTVLLMNSFWTSRPPGIGTLMMESFWSSQPPAIGTNKLGSAGNVGLFALGDDCAGTGKSGNLYNKCPVVLSQELAGSVVLSRGVANASPPVLLLAGNESGMSLFALGNDIIGTGRQGDLYSAFPVPVERLLRGKAVFLGKEVSEEEGILLVDWERGVKLFALGNDCIGTGKSGNLLSSCPVVAQRGGYVVLTKRFLTEAPPGMVVLSTKAEKPEAEEARPERPEEAPAKQPLPAKGMCGPTLLVLLAAAALACRGWLR